MQIKINGDRSTPVASHHGHSRSLHPCAPGTRANRLLPLPKCDPSIITSKVDELAEILNCLIFMVDGDDHKSDILMFVEQAADVATKLQADLRKEAA